MSQKRLSVNCLVQVTGDNKLDFDEWLTYHLALGFDTIFVCDSGDHKWLDELCAKKGDRVVLAPRDERWKYKSEIISDYVSRREFEEWCVCVDDHDFLWLAPGRAKSIVDYVELIPPNIAAVTCYVLHMSSREPMRYRVGTQIDCFVHRRNPPEGCHYRYESMPNHGITMFRVVDRKMPLRDPVTPVYANAWVDAEFRQMTPTRYNEEIHSYRYRPEAYSFRCYRYGIRSGVEMDFDDSMVPRGFYTMDLSMQQARERLMHIPVNDKTEELFAKKDPPPKEDRIAGVMFENQAEVAKSIINEKGLPLTRARIDKLIFKGQFFEDILAYAESKDPSVDKDLLFRVFDEERRNIVATSTLYTDLQELLDQGKTDSEIRRTLCVTDTTLNLMKMALPVLDIGDRSATAAEPETRPDSQPVAVKVGDAPAVELGEISAPESPAVQDDATELPMDESLVEDFEKSLAASAPTDDELAEREKALSKADDKKAAKKAGSKKATTKATPAKKKAKVVAGTVKKVSVSAKQATPVTPAAEPSDDGSASLDGLDGSMLDEISVDAVIESVSGKPEDKA